MITHKPNNSLGKGDHGWLKTSYHFSFANYFNSKNMKFGVLRVLNDDWIAPHSGFDTHPHEDMEILTYILEGKLTHRDSMGNEGVLGRGGVQYMSAGTGVYHSEHNAHDKPLHLLQIWIFPDRKNHTPRYGDWQPAWEERVNKALKIAGPDGDNSVPVQLHQDVNFHVVYLESGKDLNISLADDRQLYLVLAEGDALVNDRKVTAGDALSCQGENITVLAGEFAHVLYIDMPKEYNPIDPADQNSQSRSVNQL